MDNDKDFIGMLLTEEQIEIANELAKRLLLTQEMAFQDIMSLTLKDMA